MSLFRVVFVLAVLCTPFYAQQTNTDIVPASPGLNLGHSNQRWNVYANALDVNQLTVNGFSISASCNAGNAQCFTAVNGSACTTLNSLVDLDSSGNVQTAAASSTRALGILISGPGCSGPNLILYAGLGQCTFSNTAIPQDYFAASATAPGQCVDIGATVAGSLGQILSANSGAGTLAQVDYAGAGSGGSSANISPAPQFVMPYYNQTGSVGAVAGDQNITTDGNGNEGVKTLSINGTGAGRIDFATGSAPLNPPTGKVRLYADANTGLISCITSTGTSCIGKGLGSVVPATNSAQALQVAIQACASFSSCWVDASAPALGNQVFTVNPFAGLEMPISLLTGGYTISYPMDSFYVDHPSHFHWTGNGTVAADSTTGSPVYPGAWISGRLYQTTGSITNGSRTLTITGAMTGLNVGGIVGIVGAAGGNSAQQSTLNNGGNLTAGATSFTVTSSAGWATQPNAQWYSTNYLLIDSELMQCPTVTGNVFSGCVRGLFGTTAATHTNGANVTAVGALFARIQTIAGSVVTLESADSAASFTVTNATVQTGIIDTTYDGDISFNGPGNTVAAGAGAIACWYCDGITIDPGISIANWQFFGMLTVASRHNMFLPRLLDTVGGASNGAGIWFFGQDKQNRIDLGAGHRCGAGGCVFINDRSTQFQLYSGPSGANSVNIGTCLYSVQCLQISGNSNENTVWIGTASGTNPNSGTSSAIGLTTGYWTTVQNPARNSVKIGTCNVHDNCFSYSGVTAGGSNNIEVGSPISGTIVVPLANDTLVYKGQGLLQGTLTLSAGWGTGNNFTLPAYGGQTVQVNITAGTTPTVNPTITLTEFTSQPAIQPCNASMIGGTGMAAPITTTTQAASPVFTYNGLPSNGFTYQIVIRCGQ